MVIAYLVELGPRLQRDPSAAAVAARVARTFAPRQRQRLATPSSLEALASRRLGCVRFTRP